MSELPITIKTIRRPDGQTIEFIEPPDTNAIWKINRKYAETVRMVAEPIQRVHQRDLPNVVGYPLLSPAQKLARRGIMPADSSPFEDRTNSPSHKGADSGVWAYVAARMDGDDMSEVLKEVLRKRAEEQAAAKIGQDGSEARIVIRNLPTITDDKIPGVYFEVKITENITPKQVQEALLALIDDVVPVMEVSA